MLFKCFENMITYINISTYIYLELDFLVQWKRNNIYKFKTNHAHDISASKNYPDPKGGAF